MKTRFALLALLFFACTSAPPITIEHRAAQLVERAAQVEPEVTPVLLAVAEAKGGEMYKLEHRLKTLKSATRKLEKYHRSAPASPIRELELNDTLRYTMRFEDDPPGHHVSSIRAVLAALAEKGHTVVKLKNYWARDDNYSGVNGVFRHPSGLEWELQFHTKASLKTQADTRPQYEELRKVDTPLERKRELFDEMTKAWAEVPIPEGILEPAALHERGEIIDRPRP